MPRTATPFEGETFAQFLARLGIQPDEFINLNPGFNAERYIAGTPFSVPDTARVFANAPAPVASSVSQTPTATPTEAPEGTLPTEQWGLFNEMMKSFQTAFKTFLSTPGFIRSPETAKAGVEAGKGAGPGFTSQEADFLRSNADLYEQRYGEAVQRQFAETGELPTLMPNEFLKTINPRTEMEMRSNESRGGRQRVPSTGVRRLRF